jgi:hypothetical protein
MATIDGAASGETKRHHDVTVDVLPRKISITFFYMIYPKENIVCTGVFLQIFLIRLHSENTPMATQ